MFLITQSCSPIDNKFQRENSVWISLLFYGNSSGLSSHGLFREEIYISRRRLISIDNKPRLFYTFRSLYDERIRTDPALPRVFQSFLPLSFLLPFFPSSFLPTFLILSSRSHFESMVRL